MVDRNQYQQQSLGKQQQSDQECPKIKCRIHQNYYCESINLNINSTLVLCCSSCIVKNGLDTKELIIIDDIFSKNKNNIIQNWPIIRNKQLKQQLNNKEQFELTPDQVSFIVDQQFDVFKASIIKLIDQHKKKILSNIQGEEVKRQNFFEIYNSISEREEIKQQLLNNQNNQIKLEQFLRNIIKEKETQKSEIEQILQDSLGALSNIYQNYQTNYFENIFQEIYQKIKSLDFLSPNNKLKNLSQIQEQRISLDDLTKIFENKIQNIEQIQQQNLLQNIQIIKSRLNQPDCISFNRINNCIEVQRSSSNEYDYGQIILNQPLIPSNKYEIQIQINSLNNDSIFLGLFPTSQLDKNAQESNLSFYITNILHFGISKVERGQDVYKIIKDVRQIIFQICLKEKILRCLVVVNNQKNIYSLSDWNEIKCYEQNNINLTIKEFKMVNKFHEW